MVSIFSLQLFSPPAVLTIHLKRFQQTVSGLRKDNRHVQVSGSGCFYNINPNNLLILVSNRPKHCSFLFVYCHKCFERWGRFWRNFIRPVWCGWTQRKTSSELIWVHTRQPLFLMVIYILYFRVVITQLLWRFAPQRQQTFPNSFLSQQPKQTMWDNWFLK